jgi:hypothetical protein
MVKFAKEEKPFDPISNKLLSDIAKPPQADPPPAPPMLELVPDSPRTTDTAESPEPVSRPSPSAPERRKPQTTKRPTLKKLTVQAHRGERLTRAVKCLFTPSEERELRSLVSRLAAEAGTALTLSHLMRPYFDLLLHCEDQLAQELRRGEITRPLNDKTALAFFERQLAEVIHNALRKAPLLRADRVENDSPN